MRNALKHSGADHVAIELTEADGVMLMRVRDDGRGFDVATAGGEAGHIGTDLLRDLAAEARAEISIDSTPGEGTVVSSIFATAMIRVLLAEDHPVVRAGLVELLGSEPDIEIVAAVGDGAAAIEGVAEHAPDIALLDVTMPEVDGIEAAGTIHGEHPETRVVILTASADRDQMLRAVDAGALGYLLKDASPAELFEGLRAAARGESPLDPKVARELMADRREARAPQLTDREREVLACVGEGLPNKLIARRLEISEKTVKAHLTSVFAQIGVTDRTQAALWARSHGIEAPRNDDGPGGAGAV